MRLRDLSIVMDEIRFAEIGNFNPGTSVFEILNTSLNTDGRGDFQFKKEQLERMALNFNSGELGQEIPLNINHDPEKRAIAWVKPESMYVAESKNIPGEYSLYAQLHRFTTNGEKEIGEGVFRYFSIEYRRKFDKFIDGVKKTIKDVLVGLAVTNSPAIKGMSPTFSEEKDISISPKQMDLKTIIATFSAKEKLTKENKEIFSELISSFSEEEKEEVKTGIEEVENKPEPEQEKEPEGQDMSHKDPGAESFKEKFPEQFAEMQKMREEIAKKEGEIKVQKFSGMFEKDFMISNERKSGLLGKVKDGFVSFCSSLQEDQVKEFREILSNFSSIDSGEYGTSEGGQITEEEKQKRIHEYSLQLQKEGKDRVTSIAEAVEKFS